MRISRFYLLVITVFFTGVLFAQPRVQKGTRMAYTGGYASLQGLGGSLSNAGIAVDGGTSIFLTQKLALGCGFEYDWAPLTASSTGKIRLQRLVYGNTDTRSSLLFDIHSELQQSMSTTLSGSRFGSRSAGVGLGMQYTWWLSESAGIYVWPQMSRTNGGPSGLWEWQLYLPIGVQWTWQKRK